MTTLLTFWNQLRAADRTLTGTAVAMTGALLFALAGLWLDPRSINGAPAWLKPAKFAASTAIYSLTLAWLFRFLPGAPRLRRTAGSVTAAVFIVEIAIIFVQAWRGTTSHFNGRTPVDALLGFTMGAAIAVQTIASIAVAIALWRQRFTDVALGWAARLGMTLTVIGAMSGGLMTAPTSAQLAEAQVTHQMPVVGAHTVGAPDGGPGIPGIHWSRNHGDLRVPHFVGLHAVQALPLLAALLPGAWSNRRRSRVVWIAGGSYAALFTLLLWQALRGESVAQPTWPSIAAGLVWAVSTTIALSLAAGRLRSLFAWNRSQWLAKEPHHLESNEERHCKVRF